MTVDARAPLDVRTTFERFPTSLKGAFVMRGADGNPHAARIASAEVVRLPDGPATPFGVEERLLDVTPTRDLFVPFEAPLADLEPGWYAIRSMVEVDASKPREFSSRAFSLPWPRSDVRRGAIRLGSSIETASGSVRVERIEMAGDRTTVYWGPGEDWKEPAAEADVIVFADGEPLDVVPANLVRDVRAPTERWTVAYPVPRSARSVSIRVRLPSGRESKAVPVPLE